MKINKFYVVITMLVFSTLLFAQHNMKYAKLNQIHEKKWQFLVDHAALSPSEIELVKPVFMEYENEVWTQHEKNKEFFHSVMKTENNVKLDYSELNDHYAEIELVQGQLFRNYHLKLRKLLKPETLFYYYKAEREFKRKLLQNLPNMQNHHPNQNNVN